MKRIIFLLLILCPVIALADLEAHFLDVGHGDCTIIICDGEAMIVDGGNSSCSQMVYNTISNLGITDLKYAIASHPDADHVGGLPAAFHAANVQTLISPVDTYNDKRFKTLVKTAQEKAVQLVVPQAGQILSLGNAQITILSPVIQFADSNDLSLVFRIDYGNTSFLFTGDASTAVERDLLVRKSNLDADVLKVSHHGSSTGTSSDFVSAVSPDFAVISAADSKDFPSREVLYTLADISVLITAQKGTITIHSDGETQTVAGEKDPASSQTEAYFVGNSRSKVYHRSACESVTDMKDNNKKIFNTAEQAESKGYRPCKNCSPKR